VSITGHANKIMSIFIFISTVLWEVSHRAPNDLLDNMAECYVENLNCVSTSVFLSAILHADKQTNKRVKFSRKVTICTKVIRKMQCGW